MIFQLKKSSLMASPMLAGPCDKGVDVKQRLVRPNVIARRRLLEFASTSSNASFAFLFQVLTFTHTFMFFETSFSSKIWDRPRYSLLLHNCSMFIEPTHIASVLCWIDLCLFNTILANTYDTSSSQSRWYLSLRQVYLANIINNSRKQYLLPKSLFMSNHSLLPIKLTTQNLTDIKAKL